MSILRKAISLTATATLLLGAGLTARADDSEIFIGTPPASTDTRPNILFVMDTSGSMATAVVDKVPYDKTKTYTGDCSNDRIYWKGSGDSIPSCGTRRWVSKSNFLCKTAQDKLDEFGSWSIGPAASWRPNTGSDSGSKKWIQLEREKDRLVECQADAAILHGQAANDNKYPRDGDSGPYTTTQSQGINWSGDANNTYVFYSGNYLNWYYNFSEVELGTRLSIVQKAAKDTLDRLSNVNVGLMRYSSDADGGYVVYPLSPIETARDDLKDAIDDFTANGGTPLSETFLEAYLYLSGGNVKFGLDSTPADSVDDSRTGTGLAQYRKPIGSACQKNFVVYLTDGDPTVDQGAEATIEGLPNFSTLGNVTTAANNGGQCSENGAIGNEGGGAEAGDGKCLDDLAKYMFSKDFYDDPALTADRDPVENVRTYTIGFGDGVTARGLALMNATATAGGGAFYEAGDTASLTEAFNSIIRSVLDDSLSFSAPAVAVNAFNRAQNLNDLFITLFKPSDTYRWAGNLKKYRLTADGVIRDATGTSAVNASSGFFLDTAQSFWSNEVDGTEVEDGGAADELPLPENRKLYTDIAALAGTDRGLAATTNAFADGNASITAAMLGLPDNATAADRTALIDWARGRDTANNLQRFEMGDPLHARPVTVIYGGTVTSPDAVVYVATNDGYLHAINPSDGTELWAYVPSELLRRFYDLRLNASSASKRYALDGNLVVYTKDVDQDGKIETADGDKVYLFFGMGRGGDNYYALDITTKAAPQFLWRNGANFTMTALGQAWSTPVITKVLVGNGSSQNADRLAMIVGGGYDPTQDTIAYNTDDTGNRLFMLDALSGAVLWTAGPTGVTGFNDARMNNSIPADVRVLDVSGDGFADRMYAADTGARIWRFDIINGETAANLVRGAVFANLGAANGAGGTSPADARRFYVAPDVSLLRADNRFYLNIAIGSGYRGHPLSTETREAFYSLRDPMPFTQMTALQYSNLTPILHSAATGGLIDVTTDAAAAIPANAPGWRLDLRLPSYQGEKVLAEALTFAGTIYVPTFTPASTTSRTACTAQAGVNRIYAISAVNGAPVLNRDGDATPEPEDRAGLLGQGGIAPPAGIYFPMEDPGCTGTDCNKKPPVCLVGVEKCGPVPNNDPVKTFWTTDSTDVQ